MINRPFVASCKSMWMLVLAGMIAGIGAACADPTTSASANRDRPTEDKPGMLSNEINGGWYGWIGNHTTSGAYDPAMNADFLRRHHVNWYWLSHQWVVPFLVADMADVRQTMIDESKRARIWVELYWWGDHSTWQGFTGMDYPGLYDALKASGVAAGGDNIRGKDWFDIAQDPAVMQSVKKTIKWQLDMMAQHLGPDTLYGVMLSEEEPEHGLYVTGAAAERYSQDRPATIRMMTRIHNELYDYVKSLYPNVKVSPGFYPAWIEPGTLKADAIVMDNYPPPDFEEEYFQKWQEAFGEFDEQYVLLWGYGNLDYQMETKRLDEIVNRYLKRGTKNIGFFRPELTLRDPIFRLFDTRGVGSYAPYNIEEHRRGVAALVDETRAIAERLSAIAPPFTAPDVAAGASRPQLCDMADQIYVYRAKVLKTAYDKVLEMRKWTALGRLVTLAQAEGWLSQPFDARSLPDAKQIGGWEMLSKEYRTLDKFYEVILARETELKETAEAMAAALPRTPARLGAVAAALRQADYPAAHDAAVAVRTQLVKDKAEKSWEVSLVLENPYPYVLNCETMLSVDLGDGQIREIYRGMPFEVSQGPVESHTFYIPAPPVAVTLATGSWSGNLKVKTLRVFNSRQTLSPRTVESDHVEGASEFASNPSSGMMLSPWASTASVTLKY